MDVLAIAEHLGVSEKTVRRAIAVSNRLAHRTLAINVEADLRADLDRLGDYQRHVDAELADDPGPREVAHLVKAGASALAGKDPGVLARRDPAVGVEVSGVGVSLPLR